MCVNDHMTDEITPDRPQPVRATPLSAPLPIDESGRIAALRRVAPRGRTDELDDVIEVARALLDVPAAAISMVDAREVHVIAGLDTHEPRPRGLDFSAHAILSHAPTVIEDATTDRRFRASAVLVAGQPVVSWVGAVIRTPDGHAIGTLAGMDTEARTFTPVQLRALDGLAEVVAVHLEGRAIQAQMLAETWTSPVGGRHQTASLAEALSSALQGVVDHPSWGLAWSHVRVEDEFQVIGSIGVDAGELDTGLALYEMRHRLAERPNNGHPYRMSADKAPSTLARLAAAVGVTEFLVVPMELDRTLGCTLVLGAAAGWADMSPLLRALGQLARRLAAEVQLGREVAGRHAVDGEAHAAALAKLRAIDDVRRRVQSGIGEHVGSALAATIDEVPGRAAPTGFGEDLDVADLLARVVRPVVAGHGHRVALTLRLYTVRADVDRERLGRAVAELVDNALRHNPAGTAIEVSLAQVREDRFRIVVSDDGLGIPDSIKQRLFLPAPEGDDEGRYSMGVGLGLVAAVAALHGGRCWVQDRPGGGAIFILDLPFTQLEAPAPARPVPVAPELRVVRGDASSQGA